MAAGSSMILFPTSARIGIFYYVAYKPGVNWFTGSSLLKMQDKSSRALGGAAPPPGNKWINPPRKYTFEEFETQVKKWADKQWLLVGAVGNAVHPALESFLFGIVVKTILDRLISLETSDLQEVLVAYAGEYRPFLFSLLSSPFSCGCSYALLRFTFASILYAIKRLRGKKIDTPTASAAGFGGGVMVSMVSGMRCPRSIISVGVFIALSLGLIFKLFKEGHIVDLDDKLSESQTEDEREEGTNNLFSIIFTFWFSKIYYLLL